MLGKSISLISKGPDYDSSNHKYGDNNPIVVLKMQYLGLLDKRL